MERRTAFRRVGVCEGRCPDPPFRAFGAPAAGTARSAQTPREMPVGDRRFAHRAKSLVAVSRCARRQRSAKLVVEGSRSATKRHKKHKRNSLWLRLDFEQLAAKDATRFAGAKPRVQPQMDADERRFHGPPEKPENAGFLH
jgi:hypothetical protein